MVETQEPITAWRDPELEQELLASVSLDAPWATVERFATLVRLSGSPEERQAVDYLIDRLQSWGVPYELHEPTCFISIPLEATVRIDEPEGKAFRAKTVAMAASDRWERDQRRVDLRSAAGSRRCRR